MSWLQMKFLFVLDCGHIQQQPQVSAGVWQGVRQADTFELYEKYKILVKKQSEK